MIRTLAQLFDEEDNYVVCCHVQPDGDGVGSVLALGNYLSGCGKKVCLTFGEDLLVPPQYRFLPGVEQFCQPSPEATPDIFVALDCANTDRLGTLKDIAARSRLLVNIDHHPDNTLFGGINFVDPKASSVAELIYRIFQAGSVKINSDIALCLYVGMVTDTGRFQYSNTSSDSLRIAAKLLECGINPNFVFQNIYEKNSLSWLKILGRGLEKAVFLPELELIYTVITKGDFLETGATLGETENLVDWLRGLEGVTIAAVFKETADNRLKISLRSKGDFDVGVIASAFNGGGHRNAAGYVLDITASKAIKLLTDAVAARQTKSSL